ncbi:MAG TPA: glycoside hydrolase family 2 [Lachnoclostridium phytofermentans]|uniref:Glycoside hydrolase family 2 n=1 Tax=Lachnoclostridium phytofermentans TaxID=66219 RepID=A0A3D2X3V3_9FIRM|nr:glycoside hydrolase family 2 TIM barrel-domain containing protein [Lachnoclostridium sp.]HCL01215.1 glycoside hydrolase family 2 [Lachnoclostridium phytofermentans]
MDTTHIPLNKDWKFCYGDSQDAWYKGFNDSNWQSITVPHDWSVTMPFSREFSSGTGYLAGGIGWYRTHFKLPKEYIGKQISVIFDGVYKNSQVWCNSYYLGKRPNGYSTFSYDISSFAHFGEEENVLSLKVSHMDLADSRWFTGSGITRKVTLLVEEPVHAKENGIFFTTLRVDEASAHIKVLHEICNDSNASQHLQIESMLSTPDGTCVLSLKSEETFSPGETRQILLNGLVEQPNLWSPNTPYLYDLNTYLTLENGSNYRISSLKAGIRSIFFDPDKGFFLNKKETKLKGVCVHHDGGVLGAAMHKEVWKRRLIKLKEMGCNAIRCSHNPHMPELYDLCDEMGFLMMDEAFDEWENAKNKWSTGHNVYPPKHQGYFEDFPSWHEEDLKAMVRRDRRHPSVILWSIGNEIDYPNDPYCHPLFAVVAGNNDAGKPEAERIYSPNRPNAERLSVLAAKLTAIVRTEDTTRPVTLAAAFPELSSQIGFFDTLDVVGYNYKEEYYVQDHARFPQKPFLGSENSHSYAAWQSVISHPFISGQFLWTGIDYLGEAHGWPIHGSSAGLLTLAGFEKPGYYMRRSLWSTEPVIHLFTALADGNYDEWKDMTNRWNYEDGSNVLVRVYTNLPKVTLSINGRLLQTLEHKTSFGYFECVLPYEAGIIHAIGYQTDSESDLSCFLTTASTPSSIILHNWDDDAATDILQVEVSITDAKGITVPDARVLLEAKVEGGGEILGLENGDLADNTPYSLATRHTLNGKLIIYIRKISHTPITLTVCADDVQDSVLMIE